MPTVNLDALDLKQWGKLPRSGQFFRLGSLLQDCRAVKISDSLKTGDSLELFNKLSKALGSISDEPCWRYAWDVPSPTAEGWQARCWAMTQLFDATPGFMDGDAIETRCAYIVIAQISINRPDDKNNSYLFVQRLHFGDPTSSTLWPQKNQPTEVELASFLEPFTSGDARIESLNMRPMSMTRLDLRKKRLEAHDLRSVVSPLGINRTVHGALRVSQKSTNGSQRRFSLSPSNRRLQQTGSRTSLDYLVEWAGGIAVEIDEKFGQTALSSPFLSSFATPVQSLEGKIAQSLLIDTFSLRELCTGPNARFRAERVGSASTTEDFDTFLNKLDDSIELDREATSSGHFSGRYTDANLGVTVVVKKTKCILKFSGCTWSIIEQHTDSAIEFEKFINSRKCFRIGMDNGSTLYCSEGCFIDSNPRNSNHLLLNIIKTDATAYLNVKSEKGEPTEKSTAFPLDSLFSAICSLAVPTSDWLLCDDSKKEWCDFLSLDRPTDPSSGTAPRICWYHAKVSSVKKSSGAALGTKNGSHSASGLQEVVGQAIKNLSRLRFDSQHADVIVHAAEWAENYVWPEGNVQTKIKKILKSPQSTQPWTGKQKVHKFLKEFSIAQRNPNTLAEVAIVVPHYKKSTLETAFKRIGTVNVKRTDPQIFWLLSGFMQSCLEVGARPVIYCRP